MPVARWMRLPRGRPLTQPSYSLGASLPTWDRFNSTWLGKRTQHSADYVTQQTPRLIFRLDHVTRSTLPSAMVASRLAIRMPFFASAARRNSAIARARTSRGALRDAYSGNAYAERTLDDRTAPTPLTSTLRNRTPV
jgi:hypothetical protein